VDMSTVSVNCGLVSIAMSWNYTLLPDLPARHIQGASGETDRRSLGGPIDSRCAPACSLSSWKLNDSSSPTVFFIMLLLLPHSCHIFNTRILYNLTEVVPHPAKSAPRTSAECRHLANLMP